MMENGSESRIGNLLLKANLVTEEQLKEALEEQKEQVKSWARFSLKEVLYPRWI